MSDFKKKLLVQGVVLLISIVLIGLGVLFFYFAINKNLESIMAARSRLDANANSLNNLAELRKEWAIAKTFLPGLEAKIPQKDDLFLISKSFEQMAKNHNLGFGFAFGAETAGAENQLSSVAFGIDLRGTSADAIDFLADLEKSQYLIEISNFDVTSDNSKLNGMIFYRN